MKENSDQAEPISLENNPKNKGSRPIWHSPAWITAIVGLVSVFLTVPEIVGTYLTKKQDIKIAQEKTEELRLGNIESKQEQEFAIVNNTLSQQGSERVFVLRYLAATLDDPDAKVWAANEVKRLDDLASLQEALDRARNDFIIKENELLKQIESGSEDSSELQKQLDRLRSELEDKKSEVSELKKNAGIAETKEPQIYTIYFIEKAAGQNSTKNILYIKRDGKTSGCRFKGNFCYSIAMEEPLKQIIIRKHAEDVDEAIGLFGNLSVSTFVAPLSDFEAKGFLNRLFLKAMSIVPTKNIPYSCKKVDGEIVCIQQESNTE